LRSDVGAGLPGPSADGGLEEFREFVPTCASSSATRAFSTAFSARNVAVSSRNSTNSAFNALT